MGERRKKFSQLYVEDADCSRAEAIVEAAVSEKELAWRCDFCGERRANKNLIEV